MSYDAEVEDFYLSVVNDRRAVIYARDLITRRPSWKNLGINQGTSPNRKRPHVTELRRLGAMVGFAMVDKLWGNTERLRDVWQKIQEHLTCDDAPIPKAPPPPPPWAQMPQTPQTPEPKPPIAKDAPMAPLIQNLTLFKGTDIKKLSDEQLVDAIQSLEDEQNGLTRIRTKSKKLGKRGDEIAAALTTIAAELDSRD